MAVLTESLPAMSASRGPRTRLSHEPEATIVWLEGEHGIATGWLVADTLARAIALDDADLIVDLSGVDFIGADTIGILVRTLGFLLARNRSLLLRAPLAVRASRHGRPRRGRALRSIRGRRACDTTVATVMSGCRVQEESSRLQDIDTMARVDELVSELRQLRAGVSLADPLTPAARRRMSDLESELDAHWLAVRRRRSDGYFGRDLVSVKRT